MREKRHLGFTIVELLVVISIIAMLVALLLPAVNAAREAARNTQCKSHLKQLVTATNNYQGRTNFYPGFRSWLKLNESVDDNERIRASWIVRLAADIEERGVEDAWRRGLPLRPNQPMSLYAPNIPLLTCPSDPPASSDGPSTSYMANAGRLDGGTTLNPELSRPEYGVFTDQAPDDKKSPIYKSSPETVVDGLGKTIMIAENIQLAGSGRITRWDSTDDKVANVVVWNCLGNLQGGLINPQVHPAQYDPSNARPWSRHSGGANVAFCDTKVVSMNSDLNYGVYVQLMSPNEKGVRKIDSECFAVLNGMTPLNASDYE